MFQGLHRLQELGLGDNNIATIKEGTFTGLSNLKTLSLRNNKISRIEKEMFEGLHNLEILSLTSNKISRIEKEMFEGLHNLEILNLQWNNIATIKGVFTGLSNLKTLDLGYNNIANIKEGTFTGLPNLNYLDLQWNNIATFEEGVFTGLSNLKTLDLFGNKISRIEKEMFQDLHNLQYLDIAFNKIAALKEGVFTVLSNLETLYLNNNPIEKYEDDAFLFLPSIVNMNFSVDLKRIQSSLYYYSYLENNNLMKCGCHLPAFVKYIKKVYNRNLDVSGTCQEGSGKRIPILDYSQCQNYSLYQRNLQCQTCSGMMCNEVTSCPRAEPVCRFAISMNGVKLKTERSCSTYRKCVEAMRNNNLTCNKRTNGKFCVGCCVGHLCNKNDFIGWTKSFVFRLIFKKFNEYKIPAENISRAALLNLGVSQSKMKFIDEIFCDKSTTSTNNGAFSWPMTKIGTTAEIPCHGNVATRHCSSRTMGHPEMASSQNMSSQKCSPFTGIWQEPDMSQCYNAEQSKGIDDGWTKSFAFRLILKSFNEYKKPAENISRAMEHEFLTVTGKFRVEYPGVQSQLRRNISQVLNKFQALLNMNLLDESSSTGNGTEDRTAETNF
ncbi:adhesion G-protein coupled receptor G6-like isoform X2 [Octopus vulgaris]|uniref:Adhesion G-protein coupled receptor G6-like isoform X2 n=1 Tax=Octopus vulgaris TaxID=6645 RepID=A0AA36AMG9_OCTVU|nr:adhesion G-protein coupled receptor G6-like isoform X2 [Octopus vulgaris]